MLTAKIAELDGTFLTQSSLNSNHVREKVIEMRIDAQRNGDRTCLVKVQSITDKCSISHLLKYLMSQYNFQNKP